MRLKIRNIYCVWVVSEGVRDTSGGLKTDGINNNVDLMEQVCEIVD